MTRSRVNQVLRSAIIVLIGGLALSWDGSAPILSGSVVSKAEARIGRPATPMSYAGVARRTTRRSAAYGAAAGAAAAGTYYYAAPGCRQVVNSYGQIVYRCP
jgi:hypothetical protein